MRHAKFIQNCPHDWNIRDNHTDRHHSQNHFFNSMDIYKKMTWFYYPSIPHICEKVK